MNDFTKLELWQIAHQLILFIEPLILKFPKYQQFALTQQIRRSMYSVTSNIAE